jgi:hypothetical protein
MSFTHKLKEANEHFEKTRLTFFFFRLRTQRLEMDVILNKIRYRKIFSSSAHVTLKCSKEFYTNTSFFYYANDFF